MGLFGRKRDPNLADRQPAGPPTVRLVTQPELGDIEVSGEAYRQPAFARLFASWGLPEGGVTMRTALLTPEPSNKHDRSAIKVVVDGEHVGYVPTEATGPIGRICRAERREGAYVLARIWADPSRGEWNARVTLAFSGVGERERDFAAERAEQKAEMLRFEQTRAVGAVRGEWWRVHEGAVAELKRQERYVEALALLTECIDAAERVAVVEGDIPVAWPTLQSSIVLRKTKDPVSELAVLERYVRACAGRAVPEPVAERLARARVAAQRP